MTIPKQYVAFEVEWSGGWPAPDAIVGFHPIVAGKIVELVPRPGVDDPNETRYGQVLDTGELVATFTARELIVCPVMSNG